VTFRNDDGSLKHGVIAHESKAEADAYAVALHEEREAARELSQTHPRVAGRVIPVLADPVGHHPNMDALAEALLTGKVQGPWLYYCREVAAWMKSYPDLWRPWHREFDEAIKRKRT